MCRLRTGRFCVKVVDYDGKRRHEHFTHELDAKEFEFVITRRRERHAAGLELIPEPMLFRRWAEKWLEDRKKVRPQSTWSIEEGRLHRVWFPRLRNRKIATIKRDEIERILDGLVEQGSSNATRNRHRAMLHHIFEKAKKADPPLVAGNPVKPIPILEERWREVHRVIFEEEELQRYCRAARQVSWLYRHGGPKGTVTVGRSWQYAAELFAWSVLRPTEVLAITIGDLDRYTVIVEKIYCKTEKRIVHRTKGQKAGGSYQSILLPRASRVAHALGKKLPATALVAGGMTYDQALQFHHLTLELAGLPKTGLRVFRHSVSRLLKTRGGFTQEELKELLGHESFAMTPRYTRTGIEHLVGRAKKLRLGGGRRKRRVSKR